MLSGSWGPGHGSITVITGGGNFCWDANLLSSCHIGIPHTNTLPFLPHVDSALSPCYKGTSIKRIVLNHMEKSLPGKVWSTPDLSSSLSISLWLVDSSSNIGWGVAHIVDIILDLARESTLNTQFSRLRTFRKNPRWSEYTGGTGDKLYSWSCDWLDGSDRWDS